jgi:hypothetical protein
LDEPLTKLNPSRIAIGALVTLFALYFDIASLRTALSSLPHWGILLFIVAVIILAIFSERKSVSSLANLGIGILGLTFAYIAIPAMQDSFKDGRVFFVALFLVVVVFYMNRAHQIDW